MFTTIFVGIALVWLGYTLAGIAISATTLVKAKTQ